MNGEEILVERARKRDQEAFAELVRLYEKRVFALTRRLTPTEQDAEDAAQNAFLALWQGLPDFRGEAALSTWVYRLTVNACTDLKRREGRHANRRADEPERDGDERPREIADSSPGPEAQLLERETNAGLEQALRTLPEHYRTVLLLREVQQQSYQEIAAALSLDLGTVKSRISRARALLREALVKNGTISRPAASKPAKTMERGRAQ